MIATGGIADISVFFGDDPIEVTKAYHKIVGRPVLTPMWALGWHQSKWGYKSTQELREVIQGYSDNNLPLDTIWSDIDYMEDYKDFTYDPVNYGDLPQFVEEIHENKLQYIPIIDAGIAQRKGQNYSVYDTGVEKDVFIKAYQGGPDLTG
jgi:alpha-glucosidase (family GH31 glycosyl hydrolase)